MNVTIVGCRYLVREPDGSRYYVSKDKKCTCQRTACPHIKAVELYRRMGGNVAPEPKPEMTLAERANRIRELRVRAVVEQKLSLTMSYFMEVSALGDTQTEREAFCQKWGNKYVLVAGDIQPPLMLGELWSTWQ